MKNLRKRQFLDYFDKVSSRVKEVYGKLTAENGSASLNLLDRDSPYETQIIYDFKPPNK